MAHYGKSSSSFFKEPFASIDKIFFFGGRLGTSLQLYEALTFLSRSTTREATRIYRFITNNQALFGKFGKTSKILKIL